MSVSSITVVGAFDVVGAILVVALMIAPAAAAYLLTADLKKMLWLSVCFGVFAAISGYWLAHWLDASIAGSITTVLGLVFLLVYFFAPKKGLLSVMYRQKTAAHRGIATHLFYCTLTTIKKQKKGILII